MSVREIGRGRDEWGKRYPAIGQAWRRAWEHVVPFCAFAPAVRKMIFTTNAVEALQRALRKIIESRGSFPNDDAALKLLYLAVKNAGMRWRRSIEWTAAMGQFAIQFGTRFLGTLSLDCAHAGHSLPASRAKADNRAETSKAERRLARINQALGLTDYCTGLGPGGCTPGGARPWLWRLVRGGPRASLSAASSCP
jgi:hypothetical protein